MHVQQMMKDYQIEAIAIGNGTASRETKEFITEVVAEAAKQHESASTQAPASPKVFVVSEDGASVYSASKVARDEFPNEDVTVRGAVSIGRRLMDPLAELVKIDPKSIGVGQYQHDVDQSKLKHSLDQTVESLCQPGGRQPQHSLAAPAHLRQRTGSGAGSEHCGLSQRERSLHQSCPAGKYPDWDLLPTSSAPDFCAYPMPRIRWTTVPSIRRATMWWN